MKVPSSWGQFYTRQQLQDYFSWQEGMKNIDKYDLPPNVARWSVKSWKKEFFAYLIDTGKYFIYPRKSLTTNFADAGEHHRGSDIYQVSISRRINQLTLVDIDNSLAIYDEYCELDPVCIDSSILCGIDCIIDLYGFKQPYSNNLHEYVLSTVKSNNYINSWDNSLLPLEMNLINNVRGSGLFLYKVTDSKFSKLSIIKSRLKTYMKLHQIRFDMSLMSRLLGRN
jgi:hypothetical protein